METDSVKSFDVIVIGGGAAGIMAALSVKEHHPDFSVAILDQTFELGRKILIAGAGRGNVSNSNLINGPAHFYHGNQTLISSVFSQLGYKEIMIFLENLGVPLYEEKKTDKGKIFPYIDNAKTLRNILLDELTNKGIQVYCNTPVQNAVKTNMGWKVTSKDQIFESSYLILSTGGKTYPALGSDGSGYEIARSVGHTIVEPVPCAVPLVSKNQLSQLLQGEKMVMKATAFLDGKQVSESVGDVMFTQYGFSGPAMLDVSYEISVRINREKKSGASLRLSFFPRLSREEVSEELKKRKEKHPSYIVSHLLWGLLTEKISNAICVIAGISSERKASEMTEKEMNILVSTLTSFESEVTGTRGWNEAEFTAGGVDGAGVDKKTLESEKIKSLYFAGEVLDVDGMVGGYNLSWAWASGWVAGQLGKK
ncbi:MAG: NAD(P)/FAD-dependent oxidoreductase [Patescibacteria group bacterium]